MYANAGAKNRDIHKIRNTPVCSQVFSNFSTKSNSNILAKLKKRKAPEPGNKSWSKGAKLSFIARAIPGGLHLCIARYASHVKQR